MDIFNTENLVIRKISSDEITDDVMEWFDDQELMKYYTNSKNRIVKESLLKSIADGEASGTNYTYGIFFRENNDIIGTLKLGPINKAHKISDLVILIGNKNYHGRGLAVEAIKAGNEIAFKHHGIRKLFGGMYASNTSSIKAYTRAGWIVEGRLKGHYFNNEQNEDRILVGCFNPECFSQQEINDAKDTNWYAHNQ
jgi:[ribosomal protein S5]-alanine N-acetyltransferase